MGNSLTFAVAALLMPWLLACQVTPGTPKTVEEILAEQGFQRGESITRIVNYRINGWRHVDEFNLIVEAGLNDYNLIALLDPCPGLDSAIFIGYTTTAGSLDRFDRIVVEGPGRYREFCRIQNIYRLPALNPN